MDTLEPQKDSYLDEQLKEQFTDLLFKANINDKEGYVYFLFEHKSYKDRMVIFQVLKYMIRIWETKIRNDNEKRKETESSVNENIEIPIIIPLVVYHNEERWNVKRTLGEMVPYYENLPDNLKKHIPNFEYLLFDLSTWEKEDIRLQSEHMIAIKALSRTRYASREEAIQILIEAISLINRTEEKDLVTYYVSECIRYMLSIRDDISEKEMEKIAEKISIEGGELVVSVAERLRQEGREKGRQEGLELGRLKKAQQIAKDMIIEGKPIDKILKYTGLDVKDIAKIKEEMRN